MVEHDGLEGPITSEEHFRKYAEAAKYISEPWHYILSIRNQSSGCAQSAQSNFFTDMWHHTNKPLSLKWYQNFLCSHVVNY